MNPKPKKIICTVTNDLSFDQRMQRICTSLSKFGYEVELVGRKRKHSKQLDAFPFKQKRIKCWRNKGFLFYAEFNIRLFFYLLFTSYDIVCSVDLDTLSAGVLAAKLKSKKVVYDAHEYFPESPELINRPKVKSVWKKIEQTFLPKADLVYTVSSGIQQLFKNQYHIEIGLIRNVPTYYAVNEFRKQEQYIIYQGALNVGRGLEQIIDAMAMVNSKLLLAGSGDIEEQLKQKVIAKSLHSKVEFLGNVKPDKLRDYTQKAKIGINLLERMGESYYLSLSNKFFDYVMAEIPQISIDFPSYKSINKKFDVAILIDSLNPELIADKINLLLLDTERYSLLQQNCKVAKEELNWSKEEQNLKLLYNNLEE